MVTDDEIRALRDEAAEAGDLEQVAVCERALDGSAADWDECVRVIGEAAAMAEETRGQQPIRFVTRDGAFGEMLPHQYQPGAGITADEAAVAASVAYMRGLVDPDDREVVAPGDQDHGYVPLPDGPF